MHKRITFRNMDHSDPMEAHVNKQLEKIEAFLKREPSPIYIDIVLTAAKIHKHPHAEIHVKTPHFDCFSEYEHTGTDMYEAIDRVIDAMYRQLKEISKKKQDDRKHRGKRNDF